jgi:hypothetical protein
MADPAASLGLEGTAEEDEAAVKMQAVQRGKIARKKAEGKKIEQELGLTGSVEEHAAIAKMQARERGRQDRAAVKEKKLQEKELKRARKKFEQMDADGNGTLEGDELAQLAVWVFDSFHVNGEPISDERKAKEAAKLKKRLDEDGNGKLDFDEFASWFKRTCEGISKYRRSQAAKAKKAKQKAAAEEAEAAAAAEAELAESQKGLSASGLPIRRWRRSPFPGAYYSGVPTQLHKRMPCKDGSTIDGLRIARRRESMVRAPERFPLFAHPSRSSHLFAVRVAPILRTSKPVVWRAATRCDRERRVSSVTRGTPRWATSPVRSA